jgi:hypothetical protein
MRSSPSPIILSIAVMLCALAVEAGQTEPSPSGTSSFPRGVPTTAQPPIGDFQPLDFWKVLKLGGAYYVNPSAVRDIRVAYAFDPKDFTTPNRSIDIVSLAKAGQVSFGVLGEKDTLKAVTLLDLYSKYKIDDQSDLTRLLISDNISIIAAKDLLLGAKSIVTLVGVNAD